MRADTVTLTKEGYETLQKEHQNLVNVERPNIIRQVDEARALGDLKENAAYHAARNRQAMIQGRIDELEQILKRVEVIDITNVKTDKVSLGSVVKLEVQNGHKEFQLVPEHEADIQNSKVSETSPIGSALMGKKPGETVSVEVPSGTVQYKIISIS